MRAAQKLWSVRALVALTLIVSGFALVHVQVSADQNNYARYSNIVLDCTTYGGTVDFDYAYRAGSHLVATVTIGSAAGEQTFLDDMEVSETVGFETIAVGVVPGGFTDVTLELFHPGGALASVTEYHTACPSGEAWASFDDGGAAGSAGPETGAAAAVNANSATVPGCDATIQIPVNAVGGLFIADAPVYWTPGAPTTPAITISAGNTARVLGMDATGAYYQVLWGCQRLWVPVESMAPSNDAVYQGQMLPTNLVG